jgi:hypothetical protein
MKLINNSLITTKHILTKYVCIYIVTCLSEKAKCNVFIEPLPRNGFRNTAGLLLRDLATDSLPSTSLPSNEL